MFCTHRSLGSAARRIVLVPLLLLLTALTVTRAQAQGAEKLNIIVTRSPITEANPNKGAYSGIVKGGKGPYYYFWQAFDTQGKPIPGAELTGNAPFVPDFDYTFPNAPGRYTVKLIVRDSNRDYGSGVGMVTMAKSGGGGPAAPAPISDLTPIIEAPDFIEAGREFQIILNTQGSGVGTVKWEWHTPKGVSTKKGLKGKLAQPDQQITVTLLVWDSVIPKSSAIKQTHTVYSVKPLDVKVATSGVKRLSPREFQVTKGKPFQLTANPVGGLGKNFKVKWGNRAEGRVYGGTLNKTGTGTIKLAVNDEGQWMASPKVWTLTIKSVEGATTPKKEPARASGGDIAGWWIWVHEKNRIPVILNPRNTDGTFTGVYFPGLSTTRTLVKDPNTIVVRLKMGLRGGSWIFKYKYNDGSDEGSGSMSGSARSQLSGQIKSSTGGNSNWIWVRPGGAELQKLRAHFGRG